MTNEEKAREIADRHTYIADDIEYSDVESAALEMAKWKDHQFKDYLEKKIDAIESMKDIDTVLPTDTAAVRTLKKIISELFI